MIELDMHLKAILLSNNIMEEAHQNQKRVNGETYKNHPLRCFENYAKLIGHLEEHNIERKSLLLRNEDFPFFGVGETCLLHDVIEDASFKIEDIENIFQKEGLSLYFDTYIKDALLRITHDKKMDYPTYIQICMENPISAMSKMMDLQDNLYVLSLSELNEKNFERARNYLSYIYQINKKYHFIERSQKYRVRYFEENPLSKD